MTRIINIFKADVHGVMDSLENQGLLLKQHLREMEEVLESKKAILRKKIATLNQVQRDYDKSKRQCEGLERDLVFAVQNGKDDIARRLIKKKKPLINLRTELGRHMKALDAEILEYQEHLEQQKLRYEQLKHQSHKYFHKAQFQDWGKNMSELMPEYIDDSMMEMEIELELLKHKKELGV
jgi:phage shock protein A